MMTSLLLRALLAAATVTLLATATPAGAVENATTWTIEPSSGVDGESDDRVSLRHEIDPGGSVGDEIAVTNFSVTPATFAVYASDGVTSESGSFDLLPPDEQPVDGGSWITIAAVEGSASRDGGGVIVTIDPESTVSIPVTIETPANATPGDHPAGIVAELVPDDAGEVQLANRVGVRVHLRVAGDVEPQLTSEVVESTWSPSWNPFAPGTVTVDYLITNDGNVRLGADSSIGVAGAFGVGSAEGNEEVRETLPGEQRTATAELEVWPVFFGWGEVSVAPVAVGEDEVPLATASAAPFTVLLVPWSQLCLLALVVAAVLLVRMSRRRSAARVQAQIDAAVAEANASSSLTADRR